MAAPLMHPLTITLKELIFMLKIPSPISSLGTGLMASTTAATLVAAGHSVIFWGRTEESLQRGRDGAEKALRELEANGLLKERTPDCLARISGTTLLSEAVKGASFIIESLSENLELKRKILGETEKHCSPEAILASNTSGLLPSAIALSLKRPGRFLVTHFWNPAHLIPLVELCAGANTAPETTAQVKAFLEFSGKKPAVLAKEAHGFIVNRLQYALLREAFFIVDSGIATMEEVDCAMKASLGRRLADTGPFETADLGGLDVFLSIMEYLYPDLSRESAPSPLIRERVEKGDLGAKTGRGLYDWSPEKRSAILAKRQKTLIRFLKEDLKSS